MSGKIVKVSGPVVGIAGLPGAKMGDVVYLGVNRVAGEVTQLTKDTVWVLACETASGLTPGDPAVCAGSPLTMELGPGLLGGAYDGLGRSLEALYAKSGDMVTPGIEVQTLDRTKRWRFHPSVTVGAKLTAGDVIGMVQETASVMHKIMVPGGLSGTVAEIHSGERTVDEVVAILKAADGADHKLTMAQTWAIRRERPYKQKHRSETHLQTGVPEIDQSASPLVLGGTALLIGEDDSGQAMLKQLIAGAEIDVIVYVACGLSGGTCAEIIQICSEQAEPKTVLVTSPCDTEAIMREATIHRGMTIASYYRDMGLHAVLVIDNLVAWFNAVSEVAGLMGESTHELGLPINLSSRLAELFAPAGFVTCQGTEKRQGSLSIIGNPLSEDASETMEHMLTRLIPTVWRMEND